jgi:electron transport complex protein RnfE
MKTTATLANSLMLVLLLGATQSLHAALLTLLMFVAVIGAYAVCMWPLRTRLAAQALLPASLVLAATLASCFDLLLQRWALPWQQTITLYTGLLALQCVVLEHHAFFRQPRTAALKLCALFAGLLLALALLRELIGRGSIGGLIVFSKGLTLATLVPGAFILLGLLLAAHQAWTRPTASAKESHHP